MKKAPFGLDWNNQKYHLVGHLLNINDAYENKRICADVYVAQVTRHAASRLDALEQIVRECGDYFDRFADAEYSTTGPEPIVNEEMIILTKIRELLP